MRDQLAEMLAPVGPLCYAVAFVNDGYGRPVGEGSAAEASVAFGDTLGDDAVGLFASNKPDAADVRPDALSEDGRQALTWASRVYQTRVQHRSGGLATRICATRPIVAPPRQR